MKIEVLKLIDKTKTVCFSGHGIITEPHKNLKHRLIAVIKDCIKDSAINFIAGGALGFDMISEKIIIDLKNKYPFITLTLALSSGGANSTMERKPADNAQRNIK